MERRELLKKLGWIAGAVAAAAPRSLFACSMDVDQLQEAMQALGYLPEGCVTGIPDERTERALVRFKRHARRVYRVSSGGRIEDVASCDTFSEDVDDGLTEATIFEIEKWVEKGWRVPLRRFKFASLATPGRPASSALRWAVLREDAAGAWREVMQEASARGATLAEPYGDTLRGLGFSKKDGVSRRSFHICGRAVDLNQRLSQSRYFLSPEVADERQYFRLLCKTGRQDGSQGRRYSAGELPCWRAGWNYALPAGWYVDLTELLASAKFDRVHARDGWEKWDVRSEWWHYYYSVDTQETFLDECELVGIGERRLRSAGYSVEEMDGEPG